MRTMKLKPRLRMRAVWCESYIVGCYEDFNSRIRLCRCTCWSRAPLFTRIRRPLFRVTRLIYTNANSGEKCRYFKMFNVLFTIIYTSYLMKYLIKKNFNINFHLMACRQIICHWPLTQHIFFKKNDQLAISRTYKQKHLR